MDDYAAKIDNSSGMDPDAWDQLPALLGGNREKWKLNACIGRQYDDLMAARACLDGYRQAAQLMAVFVKANNFHQDTLVYPFAYCWRHYVELAIKTIVHEADSTLDLHGHQIMKLWQHARPVFLATIKLPSEDAIKKIDGLIQIVNDIDQSGQTFRYITSNRGDRHLASDTLLNIDDFNIVLCSLADVLESCIWALDNRDR